MSTTTKARYIARCKGCGCHTSGLTAGQDARRSKNDPARCGAVYTSGMGNIVLDCRKCGEARRAFPVRGIVSHKHECNDRCLSSTGTQCECSCGGKNHGASHAA